MPAWQTPMRHQRPLGPPPAGTPFAFENQRLFDLLRFNTTMTTITAEQSIKDHYALMYSSHYSSYPQPLTLTQLQALVTTDRLLLPIPQREIDNNTTMVIPQNPSY